MNDSPIRRPDERAGLLLRELYRRHGYQSYRMSKFEPYDLYARNKSFLVSENILTFTDTDGRLMALKPDVTLSIIKNIQPSGQALEKVYYHENVYRTSPAAAGYREIMQTGLECTGALDLSAMGEVLALAAESLALLSEEYLLDLGHVGLVSGLLAEQESLEDGVRTALLGELGRKNAPAIRSLCAQAGLEHGLSEKLCRLSRLYGPPAQVLPQLETLAGGHEAMEALEELDGLCRILERLDLLERVRLDFSIVNDMRYYNGVIFRGYLPGLASGVLAGGRYDNLLRRMGKTGGAIGFAVYLDQLERLDQGGDYDVDVLLKKDEEDAFVDMGLRLGRSGREAKRAYKLAKKAEAAHRRAVVQKQEALCRQKGMKILIAAHSYVAEDPCLGRTVTDYLKKAGVVPLRADLTDREAAVKRSRELSPTCKWELNREILGGILLREEDADGLILLSAFPCGPDAMVNEIIARRVKGMPILNLVLDSQSGTAGVETRLESFIDIIRFKEGTL